MNLRRVMRDKRAIVLPLALVAAGNLVAYLLGAAPLRAAVASAEQRGGAATAEVATATAQFADAKATIEGRSTATEQLRRFYDEVLPADQATARRLTYFELAEMATAAGLRVSRRTQSLERDKDSRLRRLDTSMVLEGRYENVREFLFDIESSSEFVVVTEIALAAGQDDRSALVLTLGLSTYFRGEQ